ncbi:MULTISPECIES: exopolysaccharide biosynthesis protein [unclassified Roseitalea]|uniref:exopolysaccharide biosynthesis protein n=1 Tax=unclassified Roseitalea TaxID=2639107 RepID=UPI00273FD9A0|nr:MULTISPECIES: exopolysaccharide biosynthesis protein [unclassified Roseitalea]
MAVMDETIGQGGHQPRGALAKIEQVLEGHDAGAETITLGALSDAMRERAFGLLLLMLALPCSLPFVYLLPQLVALPMVVLAWQMAAGRRSPWLPEALRKRTLPVSGLLDVVARTRRYGGWIERFVHPRLLPLSGDRGTRVVGALLVVPCLSILVPLPLTNTVPGVGVALAAVGLIERDGLALIGGLIVALSWVLLLAVGGPALIYLLVDLIVG